jgi:hypothetical protein
MIKLQPFTVINTFVVPNLYLHTKLKQYRKGMRGGITWILR